MTAATAPATKTASTEPHEPAGVVTQSPGDSHTQPPPTTDPVIDEIRVWSKQEPADESRNYYGELETGRLTAWDDLSGIPDIGWDSLDFDRNNYIILTYYCRCSGVILEKMTVSDGIPSYDLRIYQGNDSSFRKFVMLIEIPQSVPLYTDYGDVFRSYTGEHYDYDRHPSPVPFEKRD